VINQNFQYPGFPVAQGRKARGPASGFLALAGIPEENVSMNPCKTIGWTLFVASLTIVVCYFFSRGGVYLLQNGTENPVLIRVE